MISTLIGYSIITGIIGGLLIDIGQQNLGKPIVYAAEPEAPRVVLIEARVEWTPERIAQEVQKNAEKYNVSAEVMTKVISCESQGSTTIQSRHRDPSGPNGREDSWGLAQFNLKHNPTITREQAQDPAWAIEEMARWFSQGLQSRWTCYREIYR